MEIVKNMLAIYKGGITGESYIREENLQDDFKAFRTKLFEKTGGTGIIFSALFEEENIMLYNTIGKENLKDFTIMSLDMYEQELH